MTATTNANNDEWVPRLGRACELFSFAFFYCTNNDLQLYRLVCMSNTRATNAAANDDASRAPGASVSECYFVFYTFFSLY